jgi:hypothetical protein
VPFSEFKPYAEVSRLLVISVAPLPRSDAATTCALRRSSIFAVRRSVQVQGAGLSDL